MNYDIICFCHLRWNFVYQRPQHLMSRFAKEHRVFFFEEPILSDNTEATIEITKDAASNTWIVVPFLPAESNAQERIMQQKMLLNSLIASMRIAEYILWYYSPMVLCWTEHLNPQLIVYDCMDELSAFKFAPPELVTQERKLFGMADLVFTGGHSLYEAKKHLHSNIYPFPSSIDKTHFIVARTNLQEPPDQEIIPHPRLGFYGVLDERLDIALLNEMASLRPSWHFILIGPVVKIDPASLPQTNNIHYLGMKSYNELPAYLAGWDIALMPFAINESTKFISPTKTPEYLTGGKPVISTAIKDVVNPYGSEGLVHIADTAEEFILAAERELVNNNYDAWLGRVDTYLSGISWDRTWQGMETLIGIAIENKPIVHSKDRNYV